MLLPYMASLSEPIYPGLIGRLPGLMGCVPGTMGTGMPGPR